MQLRRSFLVSLVVASSLTVVWGTGCGSTAEESIRSRPKGAAGADDPGGSLGESPAPTPAEAAASQGQTKAEFCGGDETSLRVPGSSSCTGDLARKYFRFAACSCTELAVQGNIRTTTTNSSNPRANDEGASIAGNETLIIQGTGLIGGSVYGAGIKADALATPLVLDGSTTVNRDAWAGGNLLVRGNHTVKGDAFVEGAILGSGFNLKGTLYSASGQPHPGSAGGVAGKVDIPPPCDCTKKLDIPAVVAPFKTVNDNASIGLADDALEDGGELTLPCGRYHLTKIEGSTTLNLKGRVAIFVDGNIAIDGGLKVNLDPGAELDLFVVGELALKGTAELGSLASPAKVRVYANKNFALQGDAKIGGNIYAPNANIALQSNFQMAGSMFANRMAFQGGFDITYDEAILDVAGCEPPNAGCTSCNDCSGATPSCNAGTCGACKTNADCCSPLKCSNGACVSQVN